MYTDNFYSSSTLFSELQRQGFGAVGMTATNRRGCPGSLGKQKKKMLKTTCERGTGVWIRAQSIVYNLWKDTKVVCTASTVHSGNSDHQVKRRVKNLAAVVRSTCQFPILRMITIDIWEGLTFLTSFCSISKLVGRHTSIGRPYFIIRWISP